MKSKDIGRKVVQLRGLKGFHVDKGLLNWGFAGNAFTWANIREERQKPENPYLVDFQLCL